MAKIRIFDNDGKTFDRYTVFIDGEVYGMSFNPKSPQGFNQYCNDVGEIPEPYDHLGKEVRIQDVPEQVQLAIGDRIAVDYDGKIVEGFGG